MAARNASEPVTSLAQLTGPEKAAIILLSLADEAKDVLRLFD